jgi:hypothetical protein
MKTAVMSQLRHKKVSHRPIQVQDRPCDGSQRVTGKCWPFFPQYEPSCQDVDDRKAGIDPRNASSAGQWQGAAFQQLWPAIFWDLVRHDGHALCALHKMIAPPTAGTPFGPVDQYARLRVAATS